MARKSWFQVNGVAINATFFSFTLGLQGVVSELGFSQNFHSYHARSPIRVFLRPQSHSLNKSILHGERTSSPTPLSGTLPCKSCPPTTSVLTSTKPLNSLSMMRKRLADSHNTWSRTKISLGISRATICECKPWSFPSTMAFTLTKILHCLVCTIGFLVDHIDTHDICS